jgi:hypothetical protein
LLYFWKDLKIIQKYQKSIFHAFYFSDFVTHFFLELFCPAKGGATVMVGWNEKSESSTDDSS